MTASKSELLWPVYEFRPLGAWRELFRYANGEWIEDDGKYDIAFYGRDRQFTPFGLYVQLPHYRNLIWGWYDRHWSSHEPRHPRGNAWHYALREGETQWGDAWDVDAHPNSRAGREAMNRCCGKYSCANGRGPELNRFNDYVMNGIVRERETKAVFVPPSRPACMYCGDVDTRIAAVRCDDPRPATSTQDA